MNKKELIETVALEAGVTRSVAERILNSTFNTITYTLQTGEKVHLTGFGTFERRQRSARINASRFSYTPKYNYAVLVPGKQLREAMRNPNDSQKH